MIVSELFAKLSYGELSNLALSGEGSGTIIEAKRPKIIGHLNEALIRLHSRFLLKESYLLLELTDHRTMYPLRAAYAISNTSSVEPDKFIQDGVGNPFLDDVIKILVVYNEIGRAVPLNDVENPYSFFTPQPHVLQVPAPEHEALLGVTYQARHPEVPNDDLDAFIDLPFTLEGAVTAYIAHCVYHGIATNEARAKAKDHLDIYENLCAEIEKSDLANAALSRTNTRFEKKGFV